MRRSELITLVEEVLEELNEMSTTGAGASTAAGNGEQYMTPHIFSGKKANSKFREHTKRGNFKKVNLRKRPYHTKMFDYIEQ